MAIKNDSLAKQELYNRFVIGFHALWDARRREDSEAYYSLETAILSLACALVYVNGYVPTEWRRFIEVKDNGSK